MTLPQGAFPGSGGSDTSGSHPARGVQAICESSRRTGRPERHTRAVCSVLGCGSAYRRSCDGEAGSWTTPLRDGLHHMAPGHRLAVELSDQTGCVSGFNQTKPDGIEVTRSKSQNYREAV